MATKAVSADAAVVEVLNGRNYVDWSVLVKTYLLAQDLWDVVEEDEEEEEEEEVDDKFKAWRKKNATALHTIQISCGQEAFSLIRNTTSAKRAWDTLAEEFKPKPRYYNDYNQYKPLFDAVWSGDWNKAKEFLTLHPNAIRATIPSTNNTALHVATELEHEHIVEELVQLMSEEDLEMTDNNGWTALALAADTGNVKMVECMVRKSKKLLSIPTDSDKTPILCASVSEQWDVVHYLYSVTPLQDLMPEKGPYGAALLHDFIIGMKFGMAWELIQCCPQLVFTKGLNGVFPMGGLLHSRVEYASNSGNDGSIICLLHQTEILLVVSGFTKSRKNPDGSVSRYKARLVAQGLSQEQGLDYDETFSPMVRHTTVRLVLALATTNHWELCQLDVKNDFLPGDLQEEVYMKQPQGFEDAIPPSHVCKLLKSLYGLKQAPRARNAKFTNYLPTLGFTLSHYDPSLFVKHTGTDIVLLLLYVDDVTPRLQIKPLI
ncbi:hypothetical protein L3X38_011795 [Prunus dulcis]|uniref:Reverse transcriptase Ty1/copia-type domain-containing protein n=1 Tax=Prunus dulcis TaxID=3755 RepID=A0AAD4WIF0_PRUDU|nr:hypothetical protein L3X38_011795 [Prunus dulcis]